MAQVLGNKVFSMTSMIKQKMLSYKEYQKFLCACTTASGYSIWSGDWTRNSGNVVHYEVPDGLPYSAIQIPAQTLTQGSENPNYTKAELKEPWKSSCPIHSFIDQ